MISLIRGLKTSKPDLKMCRPCKLRFRMAVTSFTVVSLFPVFVENVASYFAFKVFTRGWMLTCFELSGLSD